MEFLNIMIRGFIHQCQITHIYIYIYIYISNLDHQPLMFRIVAYRQAVIYSNAVLMVICPLQQSWNLNENIDVSLSKKM